MKRRIITSIFIAAVILGGFVIRYFDEFFFDALILFISIMALIEVSHALTASGRYAKPMMFFLVAHVVISYILIKLAVFTQISPFFERFAPASRYSSYLYLSIEIPILFISMFIASFFTKRITFDRIVSTAFVMFYPTILLVFMLSINNIYPIHENFTDQTVLQLFGFFGLAMLFAVSMLSDTMALLVGISIKGPKLCPNLSPKKTISGAIGGLVGGFAGAMIVYGVCHLPFLGALSVFVEKIPFYHFAIMGIAGSVFTQTGDLAASYLKRSCGIKDFSNAFPGHGGFMDRLDGLMFNSIFVYFYMLVFIIFLFWN